MNIQKGSAHVAIVVVLVVALIGALGFIFWQNFIQEESVVTNNDTAKTTKVDPYKSWKTYSSKKEGYSIKYPSNWLVINETDDDGPYIRNFDPLSRPNSPKQENTNYPVGYINLTVHVDENDSNYRAQTGMSPTEFYNKLGKEEVGGGAVTYSPEDVKNVEVGDFDGKSAKSVFTETNEVIFILNDGKLYSISLFPYGSSSEGTVKKILDSFSV